MLPWGRRQKRLTQYIVRLRRVVGFSYYKLLMLSVGRVLYDSKLFPLCERAHLLSSVVAGLARVNGVTITNPLHQLYVADLVSLAVASVGCLRALTTTNLFFTQTQDAPSYLEVDELCQSVVILSEPNNIKLEPNSTTRLPFTTLKCYN